MTTPLTHPSLLHALPAQQSAAPDRPPLDLRVHIQRITADTYVVTDPRRVLAHARTAARTEPGTAALLGHTPLTPLSLSAAAALLTALHDDDGLEAMGLHPAGHATCISAARTDEDPVILELSDAPEHEDSPR
ncbi:hypothetical protein ABZ778_29795 [Streptomyces bacillaris]|uniref:hypothetical protein n=1 Tax=Streptomyces bacillaris TaxID=68179 RepID=UPI00100866F2